MLTADCIQRKVIAFFNKPTKPTSKSNIPQPDGDYQPIDTAANNVDSVCKAGNKLNSLTTRTPSSVYSMRARVSVASSAMTDLGFFDSMIMFWV